MDMNNQRDGFDHERLSRQVDTVVELLGRALASHFFFFVSFFFGLAAGFPHFPQDICHPPPGSDTHWQMDSIGQYFNLCSISVQPSIPFPNA